MECGPWQQWQASSARHAHCIGGCCPIGSCHALTDRMRMQELLGVKPVWWAAGAKEYPLSLQTLTALEFLLLGLFELRRYQGWKATKQASLQSPGSAALRP